MNIIFADGPRQVVNAITLYSVMRMDLLPGGENAPDNTDSSPFIQFFDNVKILAEDDNRRALVLFGMLFTLVIWVLSILKLAIAIILYLIFLFHHIPSEDGTLKAYCRRKITTRLTRIVRRKVNKALAKGMALQDRKPTQPNMGLGRAPTLPTMADDDKAPIVTTISRSTTQTTLPLYSSRPGTVAPDRNPTLPSVAAFEGKPPLSRIMTESSAYSESASLSGTTIVSGYSPLDRQTSPAPPVPPLPNQVPMPQRTQTPMSQSNYTPAPPSSVGGMSRMASAHGFRDASDTQSPYETYPPQDFPLAVPYHSFSPTETPGRIMSPGESRPARTFTPHSHRGTPDPPSQASYPVQSFNPAGDGPARPKPSFSPVDGPATRNFSHVGPNGTLRSSGPGSYVPFNQTYRNSPAPYAGADTSSSPIYQPARPGTLSPSNKYDNRPAPVRAYTSQTYSPHPQNPRQDYV
ncbi:hypothetical protein BBP40_006659 [Aspergillus hancockii]|nr:hypothetical protein BBP40_006659 [Aspergillus hancockii]